MATKKTILAFGASNSSTSINQRFAEWAANQLAEEYNLKIIRITDFDLPMFGVDLEKELGKHPAARKFVEVIGQADGIILSLAEHNGSYTAAFKNLLDWASRIEGKLWQDKTMLVLSTSPGRRGGASVMSSFLGHMPYMGADIKSHFSLPSFNLNFQEEEGIVDAVLQKSFYAAYNEFAGSLKI